jgi:purine-binding chemotaxis protein CheW
MAALSPETSDGGAAAGHGSDRVLLFTVDGRELAVPIGSVLEIIGHRGAASVPRADPAVEGILPLRGRMVTVVDVRRGLGLPSRPVGSKAEVIVIDSSGDLLGLVVDAVTRVAATPVEVPILDPADLLKGTS